MRVLAKAGMPWQTWTGNPITPPATPAPDPEPEPLTDIILTNLLADISVDALAGTADQTRIVSLTPTRRLQAEHTEHREGGTTPLYMAADTNGKASIRHDGNFPLLAPTWAAPLPADTPVTVFYVYQVAVNGTGTFHLSDGASGKKVRYATGTDGSNSVEVHAPVTIAGTTGRGTGWRVDAVQITDGTYKAWLNSKTSITGSVSTTGYALGGVGSGYIGGSGTGWDVSIRAILPYEGAMATADVERMLDFLAGKYDITLAW